MILPIILVAGSLAFFIFEVFFVSFGVLTVIGLTLGVVGVVLAFESSAAYGWILIGSFLVGIPVAVRLAFKLLPLLPFARGFYLKPPQLTDSERRAATTPPDHLAGAVGTATSALRPAGSALFGDRPIQVVTTGMRIPRGARIRVVEVSGNRVVVEPETTPTPRN